MCGIVGYIGKGCSIPFLIDGLKRLEYRGYDSAGLAVLENGKIVIEKTKGKVLELEKLVSKKNYTSSVGIAHTRWATHGEPNNTNAHPHADCSGELAIVHNGIIENFSALKKYLEDKGHKFASDTDTEVIAHLIEEHYDGRLFLAIS
ncbi:MAG TPA: class II glutamine amidotransferase, partial [Spirochaetota bacterium]|nr:class II glutamine amidotransferase [Spirochaetota bacterium]